MIIVKIFGGIGNQMFQYAAGRALAEINETDLLLDIRNLKKNNYHNGTELTNVFNLTGRIAKDKEIKNLIGLRYYKLGHKIYPYLPFRKNDNYFVEKKRNLYDHFFSIKDNSYLSGYWQSFHYFLRFNKIILSEFTFKKKESYLNKKYVDLISREHNSVSIHIRRGDYLTSPAHNICDINYFKSAINKINYMVNEPKYFLFSDDIEWVKKNINLKKNCHFINHNQGKESYYDMMLMSLCKHSIISNSTFSWWAAWLNKNKNGIRIAPSKWFARNHNSNLIIPNNWNKINI